MTATETGVDLRQQPYTAALAQVERRLEVRVLPETRVVKRRSVGARTERGTWLRLTAQDRSSWGTRGWNGIETSQGWREWRNPRGGRVCPGSTARRIACGAPTRPSW